MRMSEHLKNRHKRSIVVDADFFMPLIDLRAAETQLF